MALPFRMASGDIGLELACLLLKLGYVVRNVGVENGQILSATPGRCLVQVLHLVIDKRKAMRAYLQRCHRVRNRILQFGLEGQRGTQAIRRKKIQDRLVSMNSSDKHIVTIDHELSVVRNILPFFSTENVGFKIGVGTIRPRGRAIQTGQLIQGEYGRIEHSPHECRCHLPLLSNLPVCNPKCAGDCCDCTQGTAPERCYGVEQFSVEQFSHDRKCKQYSDSGPAQCKP